MSVYNGERFLRTAIDSVLAQTFQDWELIVVDDASTDSTPQILAEYTDSRIRVLRNEKNSKQAVCSNRGLAVASGRYIARLDADDVSLPDRLAEQVTYLDAHPDVTFVASAVHLIDEAGGQTGSHPGNFNDCSLKFKFAVTNVVIHSSVMLRAEAVRQLNGYDEDPKYWFTEDYEFLARAAFQGKARILPQAMVEYRVHPSSVSLTNVDEQYRQGEFVARAILEKILGHTVSDRGWQAWWRFQFTKPGVAVAFESDEVSFLSSAMLGLLREVKHDPEGQCHAPWYWARHALALALGLKNAIPIGARLRLLVLGLNIAAQRMLVHRGDGRSPEAR
jgi:glycosyltransferase involved in cell wall biosynthesis